MEFVAGIDYSLTSPAVCVGKIVDGKLEFKNCKFHFIKRTKYHESFGVFRGYDYPKYSSEIERYVRLAEWTIECIRWYTGRVEHVFIEDYAFAATGRVFNIGENTGILKEYLHRNGFRFTTIPPTVIKKFATGKGNAKKELMYETFLEETNIDLQNRLSPRSIKITNPVSDIVDSYYICKTGLL